MGGESSKEGWDGALRQVLVSQTPVAHGTCYRVVFCMCTVLHVNEFLLLATMVYWHRVPVLCFPPLLTPYVCTVPSPQVPFPGGVAHVPHVPTSPLCDAEIPCAGSSLPGDQER